MKELNEKNFADYSGKNRIAIIDFWAPWCGPCAVMSPILEELEKEMNDIFFGKVNVDENVELARKFGIMSIPTFIILVNGEETDRLIGVIQKSEMKTKLSSYI